MTAIRKVEVFSAGCPACQAAIELVKHLVCSSCEASILDMNTSTLRMAKRAQALGVRSVQTVAINGQLAAYCVAASVEEQALRAAGLGQA